MGWSGRFEAKNLPAEWEGYQGLASLMEERLLTNRQAQAILMYCRGFGPAATGKILGVNRQDVHKALHVGVRHLIGGRQELAAIRHEWARAVMHCYTNRRGGGGNAALIFDGHGQLVSLRAKIVSVDDFEVTKPLHRAYLSDGTPVDGKRGIADLDLFAELLAAIYADRDPEEVLETLLPDDPREDPEEMILRRTNHLLKVAA